MDMSRALDNKKTMDKTNEEKEKSTVKEYDKYNVNEEINNEEMRIKVKVAPESSATEIERSNKGITISDPYEETNNQRTARISGNKNMTLKSGTDSLRQNIELAFPNYKVNPKPRYPMLARRKGYEGTILLRVFVLESGGVGKVELEKSSGYEILDESALKAVREWVFMPGKKNGEPIPSWVTIPIKFQLKSG
jgi:TonB family protein